jgi:hypothetical protein
LKIRNVEGYRNYDKSEFADKAALYDGDDEKLEDLWKKEHGLKDFTEKKQFKSYEQLKTRLDKVLGFEGAMATTKAEDVQSRPWTEDEVKVLDSAVTTKDEDLDYFKSLAAQ